MVSRWWRLTRSCRRGIGSRSSSSARSSLACSAVDFVFIRVLRSPRMTRALVVLAVIAVVATGCASRGEVRQLRSELIQLRSELVQLRAELNGARAAQDSPLRDIARANADVQGLDARTRELASSVRETSDEVVRLGARIGVTEEAVRATRARVDTLATPPPAPPPVPAPPPARTPPPPSSKPSPASPRAQPPAPPPIPAPVPAPAPPPASAAALPPAPPAARPLREPQEARATGAEKAYAAAMATFRAREHGQAVLDLLDFLSRYPPPPRAAATERTAQDRVRGRRPRSNKAAGRAAVGPTRRPRAERLYPPGFVDRMDASGILGLRCATLIPCTCSTPERETIPSCSARSRRRLRSTCAARSPRTMRSRWRSWARARPRRTASRWRSDWPPSSRRAA